METPPAQHVLSYAQRPSRLAAYATNRGYEIVVPPAPGRKWWIAFGVAALLAGLLVPLINGRHRDVPLGFGLVVGVWGAIAWLVVARIFSLRRPSPEPTIFRIENRKLIVVAPQLTPDTYEFAIDEELEVTARKPGLAARIRGGGQLLIEGAEDWIDLLPDASWNRVLWIAARLQEQIARVGGQSADTCGDGQTPMAIDAMEYAEPSLAVRTGDGRFQVIVPDAKWNRWMVYLALIAVIVPPLIVILLDDPDLTQVAPVFWLGLVAVVLILLAIGRLSRAGGQCTVFSIEGGKLVVVSPNLKPQRREITIDEKLTITTSFLGVGMYRSGRLIIQSAEGSLAVCENGNWRDVKQAAEALEQYLAEGRDDSPATEADGQLPLAKVYKP